MKTYELTLAAFAAIWGATVQETVREFFPEQAADLLALAPYTLRGLIVRVNEVPGKEHYVAIANPKYPGLFIEDDGDLGLDNDQLTELEEYEIGPGRGREFDERAHYLAAL